MLTNVTVDVAVGASDVHVVTWTGPGPLGLKVACVLDERLRLVVENVMPQLRKKTGVHPGMRIVAVNGSTNVADSGNPDRIYAYLRSTERPLSIGFAAPPGLTIKQLRLVTGLKAMRGCMGYVLDDWRVNMVLATMKETDKQKLAQWGDEQEALLPPVLDWHRTVFTARCIITVTVTVSVT